VAILVAFCSSRAQLSFGLNKFGSNWQSYRAARKTHEKNNSLQRPGIERCRRPSNGRLESRGLTSTCEKAFSDNDKSTFPNRENNLLKFRPRQIREIKVPKFRAGYLSTSICLPRIGVCAKDKYPRQGEGITRRRRRVRMKKKSWHRKTVLAS
jgi:hypothetical protein